MEVDAAVHHISRQRACTTAAATQTMIIAPVLAAATYAATASVPVIEHITPDPVVYTAPAPVNEYVASAHVSEYVAPSLVTEHETPAVLAPVVQIVQFPQVQDPQSKICEKNVETVAFLSGQDTQASVSLGTAPVCHVNFANTLEVVEFEPHLPAELVSSSAVVVHR